MGCVDVGSPACADDILEIAFTESDLQLQLDISQSFADTNRYTIHGPLKSKAVAYRHPLPSGTNWALGDHTIPISESLTHLGITRVSNQLAPDAAIDGHISGARATLYSLMGAGLHGRNGLTCHLPDVHRQYIVSRLTYGLESLCLTAKQLDRPEKFHRKNLCSSITSG